MKRLRFWLIVAFPRWLAFGRMCLYTSDEGYHCCLSKGHLGKHHGDVSFEKSYRKAEAYYRAEREKIGK
jgi:hypothetical protein